jgi:hypothetical protein
MAYPSFPFAPGAGGLLIPFDPSHMIVNNAFPIVGTITTAVPGISGGAVIYRPNAGFDVEQAMLNTWIDPPALGISSAVVYPLRWGLMRGFIALSPGGGS